jgi:hypothetical protein
VLICLVAMNRPNNTIQPEIYFSNNQLTVVGQLDPASPQQESAFDFFNHIGTCEADSRGKHVAATVGEDYFTSIANEEKTPVAQRMSNALLVAVDGIISQRYRGNSATPGADRVLSLDTMVLANGRPDPRVNRVYLTVHPSFGDWLDTNSSRPHISNYVDDNPQIYTLPPEAHQRCLGAMMLPLIAKSIRHITPAHSYGLLAGATPVAGGRHLAPVVRSINASNMFCNRPTDNCQLPGNPNYSCTISSAPVRVSNPNHLLGVMLGLASLAAEVPTTITTDQETSCNV